ncbi:hypothetical protein MP228_008717 [Amoeboaphelidium protococcarum]|nr:hypothetical protein MP228_008717 [Amoeboaphelidium protococcarum]
MQKGNQIMNSWALRDEAQGQEQLQQWLHGVISLTRQHRWSEFMSHYLSNQVTPFIAQHLLSKTAKMPQLRIQIYSLIRLHLPFVDSTILLMNALRKDMTMMTRLQNADNGGCNAQLQIEARMTYCVILFKSGEQNLIKEAVNLIESEKISFGESLQIITSVPFSSHLQQLANNLILSTDASCYSNDNIGLICRLCDLYKIAVPPSHLIVECIKIADVGQMSLEYSTKLEALMQVSILQYTYDQILQFTKSLSSCQLSGTAILGYKVLLNSDIVDRLTLTQYECIRDIVQSDIQQSIQEIKLLDEESFHQFGSLIAKNNIIVKVSPQQLRQFFVNPSVDYESAGNVISKLKCIPIVTRVEDRELSIIHLQSLLINSQSIHKNEDIIKAVVQSFIKLQPSTEQCRVVFQHLMQQLVDTNQSDSDAQFRDKIISAVVLLLQDSNADTFIEEVSILRLIKACQDIRQLLQVTRLFYGPKVALQCPNTLHAILTLYNDHITHLNQNHPQQQYLDAVDIETLLMMEWQVQQLKQAYIFTAQSKQ